EFASSPQVTFDSQGDAVVLWTSSEFPSMGQVNIRIHYSVRPAGGSFGLPQPLDEASTSNFPSTNIIFTPAPLATDAHGDVFALWGFSMTASMSSATSMRASVLTPGGSFSMPAELAKGTAVDDAVEFPTIAADPQGDALAAWRHRSVGGSK